MDTESIFTVTYSPKGTDQAYACRATGTDGEGYAVSIDGESLGNFPSLTTSAKAAVAFCRFGEVTADSIAKAGSMSGPRFWSGEPRQAGTPRGQGTARGAKVSFSPFAMLSALADQAGVLLDYAAVTDLMFGADIPADAGAKMKELCEQVATDEQARRDDKAKVEKASKANGAMIAQLRKTRDMLASLGQDTSGIETAMAALQLSRGDDGDDGDDN